MNVNPNEFNRIIIIQKFEIYKDELFNEIQEWTDYYKCYAGIKSNSDFSKIEESRPDYNTTIEFKIRYCCKCTDIIANPSNFRICYNNKLYVVKSAIDINELHKIVKIMAVIDNG